MKAEYVNPFFHATREVFKLMLDLDINRCDRAKSESCFIGKEVSAVIEITGDLTGIILYRFPEEMILEIVKIMSGMEIDTLDSFVTSALGEMSNIISGNATTNLFAQNYTCDIRPPKIMVGEYKPNFPTKEVLSVPLETSIGNMVIEVSLKENKAS